MAHKRCIDKLDKRCDCIIDDLEELESLKKKDCEIKEKKRMKPRPVKLRKTWKISPVTKIKENKEMSDGCKLCGFYKTNPEMCTLDSCPEIGGA